MTTLDAMAIIVRAKEIQFEAEKLLAHIKAGDQELAEKSMKTIRSQARYIQNAARE